MKGPINTYIFMFMIFAKIVEILFIVPIHWVIITNTQYKVYFACLIFKCWDFGKYNLKLLNFIF